MGDSNTLEMLLFFASFPFFALGFIGNVLVVRIVHTTREMHTKTNYILVNLALSDASQLQCRRYISFPITMDILVRDLGNSRASSRASLTFRSLHHP